MEEIIIYVSSCCGADVKIVTDDRPGWTNNWHECGKCGKSCDGQQQLNLKEFAVVHRLLHPQGSCTCGREGACEWCVRIDAQFDNPEKLIEWAREEFALDCGIEGCVVNSHKVNDSFCRHHKLMYEILNELGYRP